MQTGKVEPNLIILNEHFQLSYLPDLILQKQTGTETKLLDDVDLAFHAQEYQTLCQTLETASQNSHLPSDPSAKEDLHDLLIRVRLQA